MRTQMLLAAAMLGAILSTANAQDITYQIHPGGAVSGYDDYGNTYNGNVAPGGAMNMYNNTTGDSYSGAVDPYGNANLNR